MRNELLRNKGKYFIIAIFHKLINFFNNLRKSLEKKRKEVEMKEQKITELNQQLNKRKDQMDQLEKSLKSSGGSAAASAELTKKLADCQHLLEKYVKYFLQNII